MTIESGSHLVLDGRYALEEVIGRGGMADVYRATDQLLLRQVAVKVVREAAEPGVRERFIDEARTLASLNHTGLITLLDAGLLDDRPFLVMELVSGPTLSGQIAQGPLDPDRVRVIGRQLAAALAYAHGQGVVHRDVKPSNVLLGDDHRVLLADFGIARLVDSAQHHTRTGGTIGSPAYLSPEQVAGEQVGPEADVFSLGLVLLECLTGVRAYAGSAMEVALARLHAAPQVPEEVQPAWRSLVLRMTRREPGERPAAADVATLLADPGWGRDPVAETGELELTQDLAGVVPAGSWQEESAPDEPPAAPTAGRSRRRLGIGVLAALVLVAAVAVVLVAPWKGPGTGSGTDGSGGSVPTGVPTRLQQPLAQLHDAIEGHHR